MTIELRRSELVGRSVWRNLAVESSRAGLECERGKGRFSPFEGGEKPFFSPLPMKHREQGEGRRSHGQVLRQDAPEYSFPRSLMVLPHTHTPTQFQLTC